VTRPEDALAEARRRAAAAVDDASDLGGFTVEPTERASLEQLLEWAVIEPDIALLRSTRRLGAPITWVKRLARRALRQELDQLAAQQTRFNHHVALRLAELEERSRSGAGSGSTRS
jgi:hypothetical protein